MDLKISIITVCLNAADVLEKCIKSVAGQTYNNIEYLVIDGGSTDSTSNIVKKYKDKISVFISERDGGIYPAMNKGISLASGDFMLMLGADDYLADEHAIKKIVTAMDKSNLASVYYALLEVRYPHGEVNVYDAGPPENLGETLILGCLPSQATFISRVALERLGGFDEKYRLSADYDWYLRAMNDPAITFQKIDLLCSSFYMGGASSNLQKCRAEMDIIQNEAEYYNTEAWSQRRIKKWQADSLDWRLRHDVLQNQFREKKKDAQGLNKTYQSLIAEREVFVGEIAKLRNGLDALEAERQKLQSYLDEANTVNSKLVARLTEVESAPKSGGKGFFNNRIERH